MTALARESFEKTTVNTDFIRLDEEASGKIKSDSNDNAVMKKNTKDKIVKLNAGWDDVDFRSVIYDISKKMKIRML